MPDVRITQWEDHAEISLAKDGDIIDITFMQETVGGYTFSTLLPPPVAKELAARLNHMADEIMGNL